MEISFPLSLFTLIFLLTSPTIQSQGLGPAPAPEEGVGSPSLSSPRGSDLPASAPVPKVAGKETFDKGANLVSDPPTLPPVSEMTGGLQGSPALSPDKEVKDEISANPPHSVEEDASMMVKWCAVRNEFVDCQYYLSLLRQTDGYTWKCVKRETTQECMDSIKKREADLVTVEPGMAYIAFVNYSMKAIANEVYCSHAENYDAVAVVNRNDCKEGTSLMDFKGRRSCHGGYSMAAGWNYPVHHLKKLVGTKKLSSREMVTEFFSEVCAPSEFEGLGVCSGCGHDNGSCHSNSAYTGDSGAFRCLVEEMGDIAFVKGDTALLYSMEGPYNQTWSKKSVSDFMYLCPKGGCREINGYPGACSLGSVPANVIMASNSISNKKRLMVLQALLNATWIDALYTGKNGAGHLLSSSVQGLNVVKKITRSYLGTSASISKSIEDLNPKKLQTDLSTANSFPDENPLQICRLDSNDRYCFFLTAIQATPMALRYYLNSIRIYFVHDRNAIVDDS